MGKKNDENYLKSSDGGEMKFEVVRWRWNV